jgi:hypothetical protein
MFRSIRSDKDTRGVNHWPGFRVPGSRSAGATTAGPTSAHRETTMYGTPGATPWFGDQVVRQQLNLTNDQFNALQRAYNQAWSRYQTELGQVGRYSPTDAQRIKKMSDLQASFYQNLNGAVDRSITNPQQRQRYNQLYLQYQGYNAFSDPGVQQNLNLTSEQREKLNQYGQDWNRQMAALQQAYQTNPAAATLRYNQLMQQQAQRYSSVLTPQQQQMWQEMTGQPYTFPAGTYFERVGQ